MNIDRWQLRVVRKKGSMGGVRVRCRDVENFVVVMSFIEI